MNINDVSGRNQAGPLLGDASRKDEVKRLAQGAAAEHFGANQSLQPQNGNSAYIDTARISDEAIEEISKSGKANDMQRSDQLIVALQEAFDAKTWGQPPSQQQQQDPAQSDGQGGEEGGGAEGAQPGKKLQKKRTAQWEPSIEAGQIHPEGREVIGKVTIKEDVTEVDAPASSAKNSGGGTGGPSNGNASAASSAVGGAGKGQSSGNSASGPSAAKGNRDAQKKMDEEGEADKQNEVMAQSMKAAGIQQTPEMQQGAGNYEAGEKSKEFDVRTAATGATQTISVKPAGQLQDGGGETLRLYKKLDDKPALKNVSLHSRGESLDRSAERYAQEAQAQGERPDQIVQGVEQLKKASPDQ